MNDSRNKNFKNNKPATPKVAFKTLDLILSGTDVNQVNYNVESCAAILNDLQNADVFNKISIYVTAPRKLLTNNESDKGTINVGKIQSFNYNEGTMTIMLFGKNVQFANNLDNNRAINVRVRNEKNSTDVASILNFELVHFDYVNEE